MSKERDWQDIKTYWQFLSDRSDDFVYQIFYPNGAGQQQRVESFQDLKGCLQGNKLSGLNCLSVNPRKKDQMRGLESIKKLNALLVDVDVKKQAREEGLAPEPVKSEAEGVARDVVDRMKQLGFQPALLIDSGNGFHVYAKVDMRLPLFGNKEEWKETVLHRKLERLESELEPCETEQIEIDNLTKDVVRRVKIPGTWNVKDGMSEGDYRRAEIIEEYDYDYAANNKAIRELEPVSEESTQQASSGGATEPGELDIDHADRLEYVLDFDDQKFEDLYRGQWESYDYPSRSEAEMALAVLCEYYQLDAGQILSESGMTKWDEKGESYRKLTVKKASQQCTDRFDWDEFERLKQQGRKSTARSRGSVGASPSNVSDASEKIREQSSADDPSEDAEQENHDTDADSSEREWEDIEPGDGGLLSKEPEHPEELYFDGDGNFVPKFLADDLLNTYHVLTVRDNENVFVYKDGYYQPNGKRYLKEEIYDRLDDLAKKNYFREACENVMSRTGIDRDDLGGPKEYLNVRNGLLNLKTRELETHTPGMFFTSQIPVEYNPDADCPNFKDFIYDTLYDEDVDTVQEMFGFALYRSYEYQKAFMLQGSGANGKSTLLKVLEELLGGENTSSVDLQNLAASDFRKAELFNKYANIAADLPAEGLKDTGDFKKLTGEDKVTAERKHEDPFQFYNHATLINAANELPEVNDNTDAFFRRWIIITFPFKFVDSPEEEHEKQKKPGLEEEITSDEELSGVLNWALEGLQRLFDNGEFSGSRSTQELRERYRKLESTVGAFASEELVGVDDKDEWVTKDHLYETYVSWCQDNSLESEYKGQFFKKLQKYVPVHERRVSIDGRRQRVIAGVKWDETSDVDLVESVADVLETGDSDSMALDEICEEFDVRRSTAEKEIQESVMLMIDVSGSQQDVQLNPRIDFDVDFSGASSLKDKVRKLIQMNQDEFDDGINYDDVLDYFDYAGEDRGEVEEKIENLKNEGELYDPEPGRIAAL